MAQQVLCRSSSGCSTRFGTPQSVQIRPVAAFRAATGHLSSSRPRPTLQANHRRNAVSVTAVLDVTKESWEAEVLKAEGPVLVDFWATWCGPCKLVAPSMVWAEKEYAGNLKVVKINCTDSEATKSLMEEFKVYGLPCLIVFKDGVQVEGSHREGAISRKDLVKYIEKHVGLTPAPAA